MDRITQVWWGLAAAWELLILGAIYSSSDAALIALMSINAWLIVVTAVVAIVHLFIASMRD